MGKLLTKEIAVEKHRELWNKIAEIMDEKANEDPTECDGKKLRLSEVKKMAMLRLTGIKQIKNACYCCEYDDQFYPADECSHCPLVWGGDPELLCYEAEYEDFKDTLIRESFKRARETALEIANLPEREGI